MSETTKPRATRPATGAKGRKAKPRKVNTSTQATQNASTRRTRHGKARQPKSKAEAMLALLKRPSGATLSDLMRSSGWQAHSVRGFLSGTVRTRLGLRLLSEADDAGRRYRIADESTVSRHDV